VRTNLVFAKHALAASAATAALAGCTGRHSRLVTCTPGDSSGSAADEPLDVPTTLRADLDSGVGHLLALFKSAGTFVAEIFVSGHRVLLMSF